MDLNSSPPTEGFTLLGWMMVRFPLPQNHWTNRKHVLVVLERKIIELEELSSTQVKGFIGIVNLIHLVQSGRHWSH